MRVLVHAVSAKSGGSLTYLKNLVRRARNEASDVQFIIVGPPSIGALLEDGESNVELILTDIGYGAGWRRFLWDQVTFRRLAARICPDVILASSDFGLIFPSLPQMIMIRNPLPFSELYLRHVLPRMGVAFRIVFSLRRIITMLSARSSVIVATATEAMMQDLLRFTALPNIRKVVNSFGVPLERFSPASPRGKKETLRLCYVSEYADHKNLGTLLSALLLLKHRGHSGISAVSTADPSQFPNEEILARKSDAVLAAEAQREGLIEFTGALPYEEIPELLGQSDAFVFPSLAESFGHPLVEAMASGLPVVASDLPIHREICGDAAIYFKPLDPEGLASQLVTLQKSPELRTDLGARGRQRALHKFDWDEHVRRLLILLREAASSAR